ncbi:SDR family NAD(P)-dependent oxidoreductase [Granulicella tundricola]|uniref:Short-chain dehydrogenase/reductase SDR n=1 Tax=Granulicella tundricola (strain ATCC BAA-1859 / DSM 23138 / MP5ACTX9) TaxID=1198114 RepID=E8X065_GRATM|nr:SDR family NAD(P)-dependent oxidoreductase [Granulicella tundricola]ADW70046.1 short-chain dehydrogenase/reductase SDR [Granulicella tundricola MP5ACTX9]
MQSLRGKTVLITGASSGIGQATALEFARQGARLLLCARRLDRLTELTPQFTEAGAEDVLNIRLDVQDREAVAKTLADLPENWRTIDILVNNAGLSRGLAKLYEDDPQNWEEMIDTNVKGLLYVTRAIVPGMVERGSGQVINLGSTAGHQTYANGAVYCATKAAERVITEGLRIDTIGKGIRVTTVDPGMTETAFSEVRFHGDKDKAEKVYQNITPLQPEDIADAIVWAATRPAHVQIQTMVLTTIDQANSTTFNRRS